MIQNLIALVALAGAQAPDLEASTEEALSVAGLTRQSAGFDENLLRFFRRGEFTTPLYSAMSENPWRIPWMMAVKRQELAGYSGQPHMQLMGMGAWMGWSVRRTLIGNPIEELDGSPESAAERVQRHAVGAKPRLDGVPQCAIRAAALILASAERADQFLAAAIKDMGSRESLYRTMAVDDAEGPPGMVEESLRLKRKFRPNTMAAGAHDLFMAVTKAQEYLKDIPSATAYRVEFDTKLGKVLLTGGATVRTTGEYALVMNTGAGDDEYVQAGAPSPGLRTSAIIIDQGGNDRYLSDARLEKTAVAAFANRRAETHYPGPGGALFSYAVLWDRAGNDLYRSHLRGLGSGRFGFALLHDAAGDDVYDAYRDSQGFGEFGGGILEDLGGNDRYEGFNQVQGCGQTSGFGYLYDGAGNDSYVGNNTVIDFGSAQDAKNNTLMGQGAGNGRRADYLEGNSLAGGVGVLFDRDGDDQYSAAMFCQGVGYWEGVGALWDSAGKDRYNGAWYAMGASAHFAIGFLEDESDDDVYNAPMNMAVGAGHDFSVGVLVDRQGNDRYTAPNLSLGAGNANGIGWFADLAGNDTYASSGFTLGKASEAAKGSLRERALNLGVFLDLMGTDTYPAFDWTGNGRRNAQWTAKREPVSESQVGVFLDRN